MEGIRRIARAYYDKASEEEKNKAKAFFKKLDADGDGIITLQEFKASSVESWYNDEKLFRQLDANGSWTLDFDEALALYYISEKTVIHKCDICRDLLMGPYFSCLPCLEKYPRTFDLCCDCYRGGEFKHEHDLSNFLDNHALLGVYGTRDALKRQEKKDMKELREIAIFHYKALSPEVQVLAFEFFESLDTDGDGQVDMIEFMSFMRQEGYVNIGNPGFFKELDQDGNGTLDFTEVMTLYYIIKSGRPFCNLCGSFIPGIFFSCVECYIRSDGPFNMCLDCYRSEKCNHNHNGNTQFLDNYTLLEAHTLAQATNVQNPSSSSPMPSESTAVARASKTSDLAKLALKSFEVGLTIGSVSTAFCSIM